MNRLTDIVTSTAYIIVEIVALVSFVVFLFVATGIATGVLLP